MEKLIGITNVIRRTNTGDTIRCIKQRIGDLAGYHVGLIRTGYGDQHIGIIGASFAQHSRMRTVALNDAEIELILQAAQTVAVGIDQGNIVVFANEIFRQRAAYLSGAKNNNLH